MVTTKTGLYLFWPVFTHHAYIFWRSIFIKDFYLGIVQKLFHRNRIFFFFNPGSFVFLELYFTIFQSRECTKNCSLRIVGSQFLFNNYTYLRYIYFVTYNGQNVSKCIFAFIANKVFSEVSHRSVSFLESKV